MSKYYYDLHLHSCLSPCGDEDMTPANIAAMSALKGLQIVALTDHNSSKNCPAFFDACKRNGIIPVPGMEITTAEEIHLVCLFGDLESAMEFDGAVEKRLIKIKNKPAFFGRQLIMDSTDGIISEEENLLLAATDLPLEEAFALCIKFGGACYPAHIDRESNGIIAVLGAFPDKPDFSCFELNDKANENELRKAFPKLNGLRQMVSSDAHYLENISEAENSMEIDDEPYSSAFVRKKLIEMLRGELK